MSYYLQLTYEVEVFCHDALSKRDDVCLWLLELVRLVLVVLSSIVEYSALLVDEEKLNKMKLDEKKLDKKKLDKMKSTK